MNKSSLNWQYCRTHYREQGMQLNGFNTAHSNHNLVKLFSPRLTFSRNMKRFSICTLFLFLAQAMPVASFVLPLTKQMLQKSKSSVGGSNIPEMEQSISAQEGQDDLGRRKALFGMAALLTGGTPAMKAVAAIEKVTQLTEAEVEERLRAGRKSIQYLLDHYDEICQGGGDNVRRYLGTVGFTSGLVQIDRTLKALAERADDFVDFTETQNEVVQSIQQADGSAYMAIFVTTSPSETPPEKYFNDAKIEVKNCIKAMDHIAELIDIKY